MRIHHLDCGPLHPPGPPMVCHVLLLETARHLVLVDTGLGTADMAAPAERIGPFRHLIRPELRPEHTALHRIRALGLDPGDVAHVVLTHGDLDHAGGLSDFPRARVHLTSAEARAIASPSGLLERGRYRREQWAHGPQLVPHEFGRQRWEGFEVTALDEVAPGMLLVSLPGHTAGHAGVTVPLGTDRRAGAPDADRVLHVGDAAHSSAALRAGGGTFPVRARQGLLAHDVAALRSTQRRLSSLAARRPGLRMVTAHDACDLVGAQR